MLREPVFGPVSNGNGLKSIVVLVAQGFPRDATEERMTLDVAHASAARAQPVAGVKLEQLRRGKMLTGNL